MWTPSKTYTKGSVVKLVQEHDLPWCKRLVNFVLKCLDKELKYPTRSTSYYKVVTTGSFGDDDERH